MTGEILLIILSVITGLISLVNFLFWSRIKRIEKDIQENKDKNENIEKNYIARFEEINAKLNEVEKNIIKEIYDMKLIAISRQNPAGGGLKKKEEEN